MGQLWGGAIMLCYLLYQHPGPTDANAVADFFRPMKCGPSEASTPCEPSGLPRDRTCRDIGCCSGNSTCYRKVPHRSKILVNYGILLCTLVVTIGSLVCLCYIRHLRAARVEAARVKEEELTRLLMKLLNEESESE